MQTLEFYVGVSRSMPIPATLRPLRALASHLQALRASVGMGSVQVALPIDIDTQGHYMVVRQLECGALEVARRYAPTAGHRTTQKTYGDYCVQQNWSIASARVVDLGQMVFETLQDLWHSNNAGTETFLAEQGERSSTPSSQPTKSNGGVTSSHQKAGRSTSAKGNRALSIDADQMKAVCTDIVVADVGTKCQSSFTCINDDSCAQALEDELFGPDVSEGLCFAGPVDDEDDFVPPPPEV